jgi:hypothetical protein
MIPIFKKIYRNTNYFFSSAIMQKLDHISKCYFLWKYPHQHQLKH